MLKAALKITQLLEISFLVFYFCDGSKV